MKASEIVPGRLEYLRTGLRLSQKELAAKILELGCDRTWDQSKIARIEKGKAKNLTLDDTLALAAALGVSPLELLGWEQDIDVTPTIVRTPLEVRQWFKGYKPLRDEDERFYWQEKPDWELRQIRANADFLATEEGRAFAEGAATPQSGNPSPERWSSGG